MGYRMKKSGDEERVFSVLMTEEEVSLFSEFLEQREYARRDDLDGYTDDQQAEIIGARRRLTLDEMDDLSKAYDKEVNDWKDLHKRRVKRGAIVGTLGVGLGAGISKKSTKAGVVGATVGAGIGALAGYARSKEDQRITNSWRKADPEMDQELQETADLYRVLNGRMTKKQFIKKHNKKNKED